MLTETKNFTIEDIEYRQDGDKSLKMRLFRPVGEALAAAVIAIHGGAWNNGQRRRGITVIEQDVRHAMKFWRKLVLPLQRWIFVRQKTDIPHL